MRAVGTKREPSLPVESLSRALTKSVEDDVNPESEARGRRCGSRLGRVEIAEQFDQIGRKAITKASWVRQQ